MKWTVSAWLALFCASAFAIELEITPDLKGWSRPGKGVSADASVKVSKTCSAKLSDGATLSRTVELKPNSSYTTSFYIRGEKIESGKSKNGTELGARIMLEGNKSWRRAVANEQGLPETGTFDWKCGRLEFSTAALKASKIKVHLSIQGKGTVWFDEIRIQEKESPANGQTFRKSYNSSVKHVLLIPQGTLGFFSPGEPVRFRLAAESASRNLEYSLKVRDGSGNTVHSVPRQNFKSEITIPGQKTGYYVVEAELYADGIKSQMIQGAFAVSRPFAERDPFFQMGFGVSPELYDGFKRVGAGGVSLKLHWNTPGKDRSPEFLLKYNLDRYQKYLDSKDFRLSACIGASIPRSAVRSEQELAEGRPVMNDRLLDSLQNFVKLFAEKTKGRIANWSVQQEIPSSAMMKHKYAGTWSEAMANQVIITRMVSRTVKKIDPAIRFGTGGNNMQNYTNTVERTVLSDLAADFDYYLIDAYTGNWNMTLGNYMKPEAGLMSFLRESSALAESLGKDRMIANDETGYAISYGDAFDGGMAREQAELTARTIIICRAGPVASFELHMPALNWGITPDTPDSALCMTTIWKPVVEGRTFHYVPLPGGAMYATAAHQLSFARFKKEIISSNGKIYAYLFTKPDGSTLAAVWNPAEAQKFRITLPAKTLLTDLYGAERELTAGQNEIVIGPAPVYLTLQAPGMEKAMGEAVEANQPEFTAAAKRVAPGKLRVYIRSGSKEMKNTVMAGKTLRILPGKVNTFEVDAPKGELLLAGHPVPVEGTFLRVPRLAGKPVFDGSGSWFAKASKFTLGYPENIQPKEALQQEKCYFKTSFNPNGHNISADCFLGYDAEYLYIGARVDDPVHVQLWNGSDLWRGDALQFAFGTKDELPEALRPPADFCISTLNFALALTAKGPEIQRLLGKTAGIRHWPHSVIRKNSMTIYEAAIPWSEIGKHDFLSLGLVIFNLDNPALGSAPYWLDLCGGVAGRQDSSRFIPLVLE